MATIELSNLEAQTLLQAAKVAAEHDISNSLFYDDEHRTALRRGMRKLETLVNPIPVDND